MKKAISNIRKQIILILKNCVLHAKIKNTGLEEYFISKIKGMNSLFKIEDVIFSAEFDLRKTNAITIEDLTELSNIVSRSSEESNDDGELYYSGLAHFDYKDAVFLQIHYYYWFNENTALRDEEICLLMVVIYERLFGYDLLEVYDTLKSLNPDEDDIDDYSNSTIEVYDSSEFSDYDGKFKDFISEMIVYFESYVFINNNNKLTNPKFKKIEESKIELLAKL